MSLNGLDNAETHEAYQKALTEGGYWFFLKYASRDEVELLQQGSGGVTEAQDVVKAFGEESPLYGFILYRRRKVLLKYLPEGTSRLLQARTAVHFTAIEDKFTPHDAVFAFATASELKESALSSEIALHTAASIRSVSESHLSGIVEDDGDTRSEATQRPEKVEDTQSMISTTPQRDDAQTRHEKVAEILSAMRKQENSQSPPISLHSRKGSDTNKNLPDVPERPLGSPTKPQSIYEFEPRASFSSVNGRASTQSARPSTRDLNMAYEYKPKLKLGPRPSMDGIGRPSAAGTNGIFRPVSTLPAGLRMPTRKAAPGRPSSSQRQAQFTSTPPPSIPLPPPPPVSPGYPGMTMGSAQNGSPALFKSTQSKQPALTPEKKRLMKALELRKKQLAAQHVSQQSRILPDIASEKPSKDADAVAHESRDLLPRSNTTLPSHEAHTDLIERTPEALNDDESLNGLEPQDSPVSAPEPSEGQSTKASSISEEDSTMQKLSHASAYTIKDTSDHSSTSTEVPLVLDTTPHSAQSFVEESQHSASITYSIPEPVHNSVEATSAEEITKADRPLTAILGDSKQNEELAPVDVIEDDDSSIEAVSIQTSEVLSHGDYESHTSTHANTAPQKDTASVGEQGHPLTEDVPQSLSIDHQSTSQPHPYAIEDGSSSEEMLPIQGIPSLEVETARTDVVAPASAALTDDSFDHQIRQDYATMAVGLGLTDDLAQDEPQDALPENTEVTLVSDEKTDRQVQEEYDQMAIGLGLNNESDDQQSNSLKAVQEVEKASETKVVKDPDSSYGNDVKANEHQSKSPLRDATKSSGKEDPKDSVIEPVSAPDPGLRRLNTHLATAESTDVSPIVGPLSTSTTASSLGELRTRRKGLVSPLKRTSSPDQSEEQFLSDESFMEELKTVAVQEAKPISVSKSPIKPVFSRSGGEQQSSEKVRQLRSVSSPLRDQEDQSPPPIPTPTSARSFSTSAAAAPFAHLQPPIPTSKKVGVSSSISQRIKALEQLSSRPTSPTLQSTPQATFISISDRKSSLRSPTGSPDIGTLSGRGTPVNGISPTSPVLPNTRLMNKSPKPRPESISVTATIIRDPNHQSPNGPLRPTDQQNNDSLIQSPLQIEHQTMVPPALPLLQPPRPQFARNASTHTASSSSIERTQPLSPKQSRRESFTSWRSGSSRNGSDLDLPLDGKPTSSDGSNKEAKGDSRGRRFLKRMSGSLTTSKRSYGSALSPGPKEASIVEHQEPVEVTPASTSSGLELGDLNIQFPDTLLWKRRHMGIDEAGLLVLEPSSSERNPRIMTKRFRLDEFRAPYIPDQDRQELPHSIILDFKNGSTLQCACETRREQVEVFNALRQAYASQTS